MKTLLSCLSTSLLCFISLLLLFSSLFGCSSPFFLLVFSSLPPFSSFFPFSFFFSNQVNSHLRVEASPIVAIGYVYGLRLRSIVFGLTLRRYTRFYGFLRLYSNYTISTSRLLYVSTSLRLFSSSSHRIWTTLRLHTRIYGLLRLYSNSIVYVYTSLRLYVSTSILISTYFYVYQRFAEVYVYSSRPLRLQPSKMSDTMSDDAGERLERRAAASAARLAARGRGEELEAPANVSMPGLEPLDLGISSATDDEEDLRAAAVDSLRNC